MTVGALDDIRVLDLTAETGAYCTKLLADLGADVIRIEPPEGDPLRNVAPFWHDERAADRSLAFFALNTNKRSVTLDVTHTDARPVFQKLVAGADIVVEDWRPGRLDAVGLGYDSLKKIKPAVIVTSVTGFGQTGPHARYAWADIVGIAMSGMMTLAGEKEDPPNKPYDSQGYIGASIQAAAGALMALLHRDNGHGGQHVDVSMQEALSINQETALQTYDMLKQIRTRTGRRGVIPIDIPGIGVYSCADGEIFAYLGTPGGAPWTVMYDWMAREGKAEDLGDEPYITMVRELNLRFLTGLVQEPDKLPARIQMLTHMHEVFTRFCASMSKWTLYEEGQKQRLMLGIISTPEDLAKNPQLAAREWYEDIEHEHLGGTVRYAGPPYRLSETPVTFRRRPPLPGEHNSEVYAELGIGDAELTRLRAAKAI
jgi:crotonobetainyl-CoA:carnitine CoA-transferase CaiB-like acyl-CoA transferase